MTAPESIFPDTMSAEVRDYLEHYIDRSNSSSAHHDSKADEEYFASLFTTDGVYDFMGHEAKGHDAIVKLRHELFSNIPHRDHRFVKVFTHGRNDMDLMALGEVDYVHHDGSDHWMPWTARYILARVNGELKFERISITANQDKYAHDR